MLEARALEAKTAELVVSELGPKDKFTIVTGDVATRSFPGASGDPASGSLAPAAADAGARAAAFVDAIEPDGASDLGKLLTAGKTAIDAARAEGLVPVVVYMGDANPTWGETRIAELEHVAAAALGGAELHLVLLGKSVESANARALAREAHGRVLRPKTEADARAAAVDVVHAGATPRLDDVKLVGADGVDVPLGLPSTIYEGDDVGLALFVPKDKPMPSLHLTGSVGGQPFDRALDLGAAKPAKHVAQRWAKAKIEHLEEDGDANKDAVVKTSLDHGVMSRYTSFLVLESDEAYAKMNIERKARRDAEREAEARVTGRDLESADGQGASVSPNHLQPGDPEVRIPAPADAQSVVVVFPFGETKTASFEPDDHGGAWVVRFLVDRHTPDGTYDITVRVTHKDGRVEILTLPYVVDTARPHIHVTLVPKAGGSYEIRGKQELSAEEILAQAPFFPGALALPDAERRARMAHVLTDAKRVEVRTPDGQVLLLTHVRLGEFVGRWTPLAPVAPKSLVHVVTVDRALNESELDVEVP
jgi:hypothetical protein